MKKVKITALVLAFILAMALPAVAEQIDVYDQQKALVKSVVFKIGVPKYVVNNETIVQMDAAPFIQSDRTFVPVRFLGNALGVSNDNIKWENDTQTATLKGNATLQMSVGRAEVKINNQAKAIDVAPVLKAAPAWRTYLPARYVAEGLGYQVEWDEVNQIVVCWPAGQEKPDVSGAVDYFTYFLPQSVQPPAQVTDPGYKLPDKNSPLIDQKMTAEYNNGIYWTKAGLLIDPGNDDGKDTTDLSLLINALDDGGSLEAYDQAESILASRFGQEFAGEVMTYARQKKTRWGMMNAEKWYTTPTGQWLRVAMGEGTNITVYTPPGYKPY